MAWFEEFLAILLFRLSIVIVVLACLAAGIFTVMLPIILGLTLEWGPEWIFLTMVGWWLLLFLVVTTWDDMAGGCR